MLFSADSDTITELDRRLRLDESILRHMIIRLEEE
jgi:ribosomal protein S6